MTTTLQTAGEAIEAAQVVVDRVALLAAENERLREQVATQHMALLKLDADAKRYRNFIDDVCNETFDTWTNGYRIQQIALNIQAAISKELT